MFFHCAMTDTTASGAFSAAFARSKAACIFYVKNRLPRYARNDRGLSIKDRLYN